MFVADRLIELRKSKELTQKDVALSIGIARTTYVRYEKGEIQPPSDMIVRISNFFHVSSDYLFGNTSDPSPPNAKKSAQNDISLDEIEFALFGEVHELDEEEKEELLRNARRMNDVHKLRKKKKEGE